MAADVSKLVEVPLFALLGSEDRRTLAKMFNTVHVDRGERIFAQGDPGVSMYILRRGKVEVIMDDRGQRIILAANGRGDLFGEISLLDGGARTASAVAVEASELSMLDRDDLHGCLTMRPSVAFGLLTVMRQRLRATNELLRLHATRNVNLVDEERLTLGQRAGDHVATLVGSWLFLTALALGLVAVLLVSPALRAAVFAFNTLPALNLALIFLLTLVATCTLNGAEPPGGQGPAQGRP
jgi:CRP-like cAMP-binding protein